MRRRNLVFASGAWWSDGEVWGGGVVGSRKHLDARPSVGLRGSVPAQREIVLIQTSGKTRRCQIVTGSQLWWSKWTGRRASSYRRLMPKCRSAFRCVGKRGQEQFGARFRAIHPFDPIVRPLHRPNVAEQVATRWVRASRNSSRASSPPSRFSRLAPKPIQPAKPKHEMEVFWHQAVGRNPHGRETNLELSQNGLEGPVVRFGLEKFQPGITPVHAVKRDTCRALAEGTRHVLRLSLKVNSEKAPDPFFVSWRGWNAHSPPKIGMTPFAPHTFRRNPFAGVLRKRVTDNLFRTRYVGFAR